MSLKQESRIFHKDKVRGLFICCSRHNLRQNIKNLACSENVRVPAKIPGLFFSYPRGGEFCLCDNVDALDDNGTLETIDQW